MGWKLSPTKLKFPVADSTVTRRNRPFFITPPFRNILAAIFFVAVLIGGYFWSLYPMNRGMLRLPELERSVLLWRDTYGVPVIAAQSQSDAWFSLGYVHAQDRLWPMEIVRMAAWGELTSLMGEDAVPLDTWYRRIGFYRHAIQIAAEISDEGYSSLHRYVSGINAYLKAHPFRIPPEFILSRYKPYPWKTEDVLAIGSMLTWLSQPCSTLYPPYVYGEDPSLFDELSLDDIPPRLEFLLSPLIAEPTEMRSDGIRIRMGWGTTLPTIWHEAAITAAGVQLRRIWTIPGWPLPFVGVTRDTMLTVSRPDEFQSPWEDVSVFESEETVLEYIGSRYTVMTSDTVRIRDGRSLAGNVHGDTSVYGTTGPRGFSHSTINKQIKLFFDYTDAIPDSLGSSIRIETFRKSDAEEINDSDHGIPSEDRPGETSVFRVPRRFGMLAMFGWSDHRWRSEYHTYMENCEFVTDGTVPLIVVEHNHGTVKAVLPTGQSAIPGSPHSFDQYEAWSNGELMPRSLTIPFKERSCVLVPLYPMVHRTGGESYR